MKFHLSFLLLIILFFNGKAQTTYFVSLTGNNLNDGLTEVTSWRTMSYAVSSASPVTGGDIVYIKAGDYGMDDVFIDKNYSPNDTRISFIGYQYTPGDITALNFNYGDEVDASVMPLINPGDRTIGEGINLSDIYAITIKNIQIANSLAGIYIWNTTSIASNHELENIFLKDIGDSYSTALGMKEANQNTVKNCLIVNATGAGMDLWGDGNLIENCKVYSDESELTEDGTYTSMDYYIVLKGDNSTVRNCYIERVGDLEDVGHGMEIKESGEHNLFVDCIAKNMRGGCFSVRWAAVKYNEFRNCKAIGTLDDVSAFLIRDGASYNEFNACISENCPSGIQFLLSGEDADYCGAYNTFNNCIIRNAVWAFDLNSWYYNSAPVDNNRFINGVIDNATYLFNCERPNSGNQLINSIITNVDNFLVGDDLSNFEYSYCDFYNNGFAMLNGIGNIAEDPLFIDAANGNYQITEGSPCIDAGTATNAPDIDVVGTSRPQGLGYDIGIYEFSGVSNISTTTGQEMLFYPNPTADKVFVPTIVENEPYIIISSTGSIVKKGTVTNTQIDFSDLIKGVYLIKIGDVNLINYTYKIIKNN